LGVDPIDAAGDSQRSQVRFGTSFIIADAGGGYEYLVISSSSDIGVLSDGNNATVGALRFIPRDPATGELDTTATVQRFAPGSGLPSSMFPGWVAFGESMVQVGAG